MLLNVGFNKEVAENGAFYWNKEENNLSKLINKIEKISKKEKEIYRENARNRIKGKYNWHEIVKKYEETFENFV